MNILVLSNSAPNYHRFFNAISLKLASEGNSVTIAYDCAYSSDANGLPALGLQCYGFSEYFSRFGAASVESEVIGSTNLNSALLSDFERGSVYGFEGGRSVAYYRKLVNALWKYFDSIIVSNRIDVIFYENISNAFAHFAWMVARHRGVKYIGLVGSRLPGRFAVVMDPFGEAGTYESYLKKIRGGGMVPPSEVTDWCVRYLDNIEKIVPDYMHFNNLDNLSLSNRYFNVMKLEKFKRAWRHRNDDHLHAFQVGDPLGLSWEMVWRNIRRKFKLPVIRKYYSNPESGDEYVLYPLHFHPESSTSILAGTYLDEYEVIRNIAFNLPFGKMLYVKDHISAYGYPSVEFYRKISVLPNVRLIAPTANTKQLIRDSLAVITLTSTVGYEALLLNKRVFLYGSVFYEFHPNVVRVDNPARLFELLVTHLDSPLVVGSDYNSDFVAAYYMGTYPGVLNFSLDDAGTAKLVEQVWPVLREVLHRAVQPDDSVELIGSGVPLSAAGQPACGG